MAQKPKIVPYRQTSQDILAEAQALIEEEFGLHNYHPVVKLIVLSADERLDLKTRMEAMKAVAPYVAPTLKSVEVGGDKDNPLQIDALDVQAKVQRLAGLSAAVAVATEE